MKRIFLFFFVTLSFNSFGQDEDPSFYPFRDSDGWGVKRSTGMELFPARYDSVLITNGGSLRNRIRVCKDNKWGIVDSFGIELIPLKYHSIRYSEFGYEISDVDFWDSSKIGFLNFAGDTIAPCEHTYINDQAVGDQGDYLVLASKSISEGNYAIYSSDGVQRTDYEFDVIGIDSTKVLSFRANHIEYYFGLLNRKTEKCGIYDGINKRIVVPPIYDDVCVGWCAKPKNPHFHEGPIVYTGTTPVFNVPLGDKFHLINTNGKLVFSSKDYINWREGERLYVNENGETRKVIGRCVEDGSGSAYPPYVMKDSHGYFLVDGNGEQLLNEKRFVRIWKFNKSEGKEKEANTFHTLDENGLQSVLDHELVERVPANYVSIAFLGRTLSCRKGDNTYDFYDTTFTKLDSDPRIFHHEHNFFFTERSANGYRYLVKSKDGAVLITPEYKKLVTVNKYNTQSDTVFSILTDHISSVDLFNERVEKIMHFEADDFQFYSPFQANGRSLLILWKGSKLGVYDLEAKEWVMSDIPCVSRDSIRSRSVEGRNANLEFKIEFFADEVLFWFYNQKTGWSLYDLSGKELFQWNRRTKVPPTILEKTKDKIYALQRTQHEGEYTSYLANNEGDELVFDDQLTDRRFVPELNRVFVNLRTDRYRYLVYDNRFNHLGEVSGKLYSLRGEPIYLHFDHDSAVCHIITEEGRKTISNVSNVNSIRSAFFEIALLDSCIVISKDSPNVLRRYARKIHDLTYNVMRFRIGGNGPDALFDFYNHAGVLLFENFKMVLNPKSKGKAEYFVIKNNKQELWVTSQGKIYHREIL